jgi:carbon-monoxide dehydrogenase medium subunit
LELEGPNGRRRLAAKDFFLDIMTTALKAEEVLVAVYISRPSPRVQYRYRKIRHPARGYAVVGVAAAVAVEDDVVVEAAIGVTGATARAFAADTATAFLFGKSLSSQNIEQAASIISEHAECLADHYASADYRKHLVKTEVARALSSLKAA